MRIIPILAALALAAPAAAETPAARIVDLKAPDGAVVGRAVLTQAPKGMVLHLEVTGLTPGWHGLHFHEKADCSNPDFTSAGGHVHGAGERVHGLLNPDANEAGDLPNIYVGEDGAGTAEMFSQFVSLDGAGDRLALVDEDGSALVVHAGPDDFMSQPIGGAGPRVACAEIR